jgi:double-strand break repair protein MRE11
MGEVSLNDFMNRIDPDDPKIDDIVSDLLAKEVTRLIKDAREKNKFLMEDAEEAAKAAALESDDFEPEEASYLSKDHKYKIDKPDQVLVRLRVEHSGFSTLNNQRFGAKFVGDVVSQLRANRKYSIVSNTQYYINN